MYFLCLYLILRLIFLLYEQTLKTFKVEPNDHIYYQIKKTKSNKNDPGDVPNTVVYGSRELKKNRFSNPRE